MSIIGHNWKDDNTEYEEILFSLRSEYRMAEYDNWKALSSITRAIEKVNEIKANNK